MKVIEPKISDVLEELYTEGCIYIGGGGCCCKDAVFFETCYKKKKNFLTQVELTEKEKEQGKVHNEKVWNQVSELLKGIFD